MAAAADQHGETVNKATKGNGDGAKDTCSSGSSAGTSTGEKGANAQNSKTDSHSSSDDKGSVRGFFYNQLLIFLPEYKLHLKRGLSVFTVLT
jgi:hypothetical protein